MKTFPFGSGRPDPASFPNRGLAEAAMRILPELGDELACYPGSLGYEPLRKLMSQRFAHREGVALPVDQIVLTTGSMQAVTLMAQVFVESPGDVIVLEEYSYSGTLGAYRKEKAELVGIPLDEYGMRMDALEGTLGDLVSRNRKPKFIYTLATYQNPTGSIMPLGRRRELLAIAGRYGIPVVEDHCYADTVYEDDHEPALWTLEHETPVIHIESLSKILGPGVRLGYLAAPRRSARPDSSVSAGRRHKRAQRSHRLRIFQRETLAARRQDQRHRQGKTRSDVSYAVAFPGRFRVVQPAQGRSLYLGQVARRHRHRCL